jgi:hypothetical protein
VAAIVDRNSDVCGIDTWFEFELIEYILPQLLVVHGRSPLIEKKSSASPGKLP